MSDETRTFDPSANNPHPPEPDPMTEQEERGAPWTIHRCRRCGIHSLSGPTRFEPWPNNPACPDSHDIESTPVVPESRVQELEGELENVKQQRDAAQARIASMTVSAEPSSTRQRFLALIDERQSEERERAWFEAEARADRAESHLARLEEALRDIEQLARKIVAGEASGGAWAFGQRASAALTPSTPPSSTEER